MKVSYLCLIHCYLMAFYYILTQKKNVNGMELAQGTWLDKVMFTLILHQRNDLVRALYPHYVQKKKSKHYTLLNYAASVGNLELCQWLFNSKRDVDCMYPVSCAHEGHLFQEVSKIMKIFKARKDRGSSYPRVGFSKTTPLISACIFNRVEVVEFMLERRKTHNMYKTLLEYACFHDRIEIAQIFMRQILDFDAILPRPDTNNNPCLRFDEKGLLSTPYNATLYLNLPKTVLRILTENKKIASPELLARELLAHAIRKNDIHVLDTIKIIQPLRQIDKRFLELSFIKCVQKKSMPFLKILVQETGLNIHADQERALALAMSENNLDVILFLLSNTQSENVNYNVLLKNLFPGSFGYVSSYIVWAVIWYLSFYRKICVKVVKRGSSGEYYLFMMRTHEIIEKEQYHTSNEVIERKDIAHLEQECCVCYDEINQEKVIFVRTHCGHYICVVCLKAIEKNNRVLCPMCCSPIEDPVSNTIIV